MSITNRLLFLSLTALILMGCGSAQKEVTVTAEDENAYPQVQINLTGEEPLMIKSVNDQKGSIGYELKGQVHWLRGNPETIQENKKGGEYAWQLENGDNVTLAVDLSGDDPVLELSLDTEIDTLNIWHVNIGAEDNEYFTGIFERVVDGSQDNSWADGITTGLNLRGERMDMKLKPTVSAYAPFYLSSRNYGFFVYGTWPGVFDFCKDDAGHVQVQFQGPDLKFKVYKANDPMTIVQDHALETGPSVVPPEWAFGQWRWRDEHFNEDTYYDGTPKKAPYNTDMVEDVLMMKAFDIPVTAQWIDRPWAPGKRGFDDYEFDKNKFPDPEGMISWLQDHDQELLMWIGPFVMGDMADYAEENNYDLESNRWKDSRQVLMDFTNPEAVEWWGENGPAKLARMGIKGYKLDRADGEKLTDSLHLTTHDGTTYRENFNDYPRQYVKAAHEAIEPVLGDDFILFPRAQYTGSARWGGLWAGDTNGKSEGLRSAVIGMQRCAVMGYPVWGSDIGGYWGDFSHEVTMRWLGFGCFSPLMETGPTENRGFWSNKEEPHYDTTMVATWRLYSKTREKIKSYVHNLSAHASETGTPIAQPLFLQYPAQEEAWNDWQTYLLGKDLLISVVWEEGKSSQKIYLPQGEKWIDAWNTDNVHEGGQYVEVETPVYKTPVFIRQGSEIELGDLQALYEESYRIASEKPDLSELEAQEGWK